MSYSKAAVLKMERDFIMKRVSFELEGIGYWLRREFLRDRNILIGWRTGKWYEDGEECIDGE